MYFKREAQHKLLEWLTFFPAVGLIGPRQVGKTSLALKLGEAIDRPYIYLDLERPQDLRKLDAGEAFFDAVADKLVILDKVQRVENLFPMLRGVIDRDRRPGKFLLLGSASPTILSTGGESLAGRIVYHELSGITHTESKEQMPFKRRWIRGGFPNSLLAPNLELSQTWRDSFMQTYLNRDLPALGLNADPLLLNRLLRMLAHTNGGLENARKLSNSLDIDVRTLNRYLRFFEESYLLRKLPPYHVNVGKRLVKASKIYIRDTGVLHTLLDITDEEDLAGRAQRGESWESLCLEEIAAQLAPMDGLYFYRTADGAEIDALVTKGGKTPIAFEFKASSSPKVGKGFYNACTDIETSKRYIVAPVEESYLGAKGVQVIPLSEIANALKENI
ncbi:MAG: ATP-binding protein [Saprospiraceae bacterium]